MENSIVSDEISPIVKPYIRTNVPSWTRENRAESIVCLTEFVQDQVKQLDKAQEYCQNYKPPQPRSYTDNGYMFISVIGHYSTEVEEQMWEFIKESVNQMIELANCLIGLLKKHGNVAVDSVQFCNDMKNHFSTHQTLVHLIYLRKALKNKMKMITDRCTLPDYDHFFQLHLSTAFHSLDADTSYSPPSGLDLVVEDYIRHSKYYVMLDPIARVVANGDVKAALIALAEMAEILHIEVKGINKQTKTCLYTSIVRSVFNEAYSLFPELNRFASANDAFMKKCDLFSNQTIADLRLPEKIVREYTPGMPVNSLFRRKQINLMKEMEFMMNPIDLMLHIHKAVKTIRRYFSTDAKDLTYDDTKLLLLVLISVSPPSNAVSIARFLFHWKDLHLNPVIKDATMYFIGAVEIIFSIEGIQDE